MSLDERIESLKAKHLALETQIEREENRRIKDEIAALEESH